MVKPSKATVSLRDDIDPEDQYNALDNPIIKAGRLEKYRKHYGDGVNKPSSRIQSQVLEEAFSLGKYKGEKTCRKAHFPQASDDSEGVLDGGDHEPSDEDEEERDLALNDDEEMAELQREMAQLKREEAEAVSYLREQRTSDKLRGVHVKNQLKAWEMLLDVEVQIHPLLEAVNASGAAGRRVGRDVCVLGRELQKLARLEMSEQDLHGQGREQLARWHQMALSGSTMITKSKLATFHKDPWTQVDDAWRTDRDRILKRSFSNLTYDDTEFHRSLLKEWAQFRSVDSITFRAIKSDKTAKAGGVSKGKRISYDPHPKLVSYMMPVEDVNGWPDQKIDGLIASLFK